MIPPWLQRPIPSRALVWGMTAVAAIGWEAVAILRYRAFDYHDWGLALYSQILWNVGHGHPFSSMHGAHFLSVHVNLWTYLLAPLYRLLPPPVLLLTLKVMSGTLAAVLLYRIAVKRLGEGLALCVVAAFLLYAPLTWVLADGFDYESLSPLILMGMWVAFVEDRRRLFAILAILCASLKENLPLVVMMFGLVGMARGHSRWWWGTVAAVSMAWFVVAVGVILPRAAVGAEIIAPNNLRQYTHLAPSSGQGSVLVVAGLSHVKSLLLTEENGRWLWQLVAPTALLALGGLDKVLVALPLFLQHMLSRWWQHHFIQFHYSATLAPFLMVGTVYGIVRVRRLIGRSRWGPRVMGATLLCCSLWTQVVWGPLFVFVRSPDRLIRTDLDEQRARLIARIPPAAPVAATFQFLAPLSLRRQLFRMDIGIASSADYLLVDLKDPLWMLLLAFGPDQSVRFANALRGASWRVEDAVESLLLLRRSEPPSAWAPLYEAVNAGADTDAPSWWRFEGGLNLRKSLEAEVMRGTRGSVTPLDLDWSLESPAESRYDVVLTWRDAQGRIVKTLTHPLGFRIRPLSQWPTGTIIREHLRVLIPSRLPLGRYGVSAQVVHEPSGQALRVIEGREVASDQVALGMMAIVSGS